MDRTTSWALFIAIAGAAYFYYRHNNRPRTGRNRGRSLVRANNAAPAPAARGDDKWIDELTGKPNPKSSKGKAPRKPVKKAVKEIGEKVEASLSGASTTGADADDDLSPVVSPALGASSTAKAPSGRDVSDMLEPSASAASVLRISPSEKPARTNKPQQQRAETPQETKKQRQNRKKAEEAKQQREADEKKRQILLEQQRRTAREARGEPAKNGLQPSKGPASNAWSSGRPASEVVGGGRHTGQLLDTFDPDAASTASSSEAGATNGTTPTTNSLGNSNDWTTGLSEEEQLRLALEDSAWETVPKGKKQKKNKTAEETLEEAGDAGTRQEAAPVKQASAPKLESKPSQSRYGVLEQEPDVSHPLDSDWGVV